MGTQGRDGSNCTAPGGAPEVASAPMTVLPADVSALRHLATAVASELELAGVTTDLQRAQGRSEVAVQAAGIGTFDWDLRSRQFTWNARMHELLDYDLGTFDGSVEAYEAHLHPDDVGPARAVLERAMQAPGAFDLEHRVVCRDGSIRFVRSRGQVLADEQGEPIQMLGAAYDTTKASVAETRVVRMLDQMPAAFYAVDRLWRFTFVNPAAEGLFRSSREDLLGRSLWDVFPAFRGSTTERYFRQALATASRVAFEQRYSGSEGAMRFEIQAWPGPDGLSVYASDVTERRLEEERTALLSSVSAELGSTLELTEATHRLAKVLVPQLADWAVVTLLDLDAPGVAVRLNQVASWHSDPTLRSAVQEYAEMRLGELADPERPLRARIDGPPLTVGSGAGRAIAAELRPGRARDIIQQLDPQAMTVLPLWAHERPLGLLSLYRDQPDAQNMEGLQTTAAQVAERAALALDNLRLYAEQRRLAEGLQRSLLTAPPQPDHVQIAVRYESAAKVAQVGGDWYDAFLQRDGATLLVIGDVVGHDTVAAAAMGQVRGLMRAIAARDGDPPIRVLTELDAVMEVLEVDTTATAVVARLEQDRAQLARDETTLRWSNAGHPPPMVICPDGVVLALEPPPGREADLLLGIDARTDRTESVLTLTPGSTVLLYTDGLVERRSQSLDEGLSRLCEVLADLADLPLDDLCDQVLRRMLPQQPEDDVALVAVRLHPHDRPRPAEAGRARVPPVVG